MLNMMVPFIIAVVALYGMLRRVDVYDALVCGAGDGLGAVSYTHLDVYKRQIQDLVERVLMDNGYVQTAKRCV